MARKELLDKTDVDTPNGVAPLDGTGRIPDAKMPTRLGADKVAALDNSGRVPDANMPTRLGADALAATYAPKATEAKVSDRFVTPGGSPGASAVNVKQGNAANAIASDLGGATVLGGGTDTQNNVIGGDGANVGTATANTTQLGTSAHYSVVGGYDNSAGGLASIVLGFHNKTEIGSTHGTVAGGSFQEILTGSDYGTIGGGTGHTLSGDGGTIAGGVNGTLSGDHAAIGGGTGNTVTGARSVVAGGTGNNAKGANSGILGGSTNLNYGDSAVIGGGTSGQLGHLTNTAWGTYSVIGCGFQNLLGTTAQAQYATLGGGRANSIQKDYGVIPGGRENAVITRDFGQASGHGAVADKHGQNARAAGYFAEAGDAQRSELIARRQTTDATPTALLLDGANWAAGMSKSGNLWAFTGLVVAHRTGATGENAAFKIEGALTRDATATGRLIGTPTVTMLGSEGTASAWVVAVTTNGSGQLIITVTGAAAKTIRWVASVTLCEVAGA